MHSKSPKIKAYLDALKMRIEQINMQIQEEFKHPLPDWFRMRQLKTVKLQTKDQMTHFARKYPAGTHADRY